MIQGPKHFAEFADSILPTITVIPGTLKVHKVMREATPGGYTLTFNGSSATNCSQIKQKKSMRPAI